MDTVLCIGVDVSSRTFETSLGAEAAKCAQVPNDEAGFAAFAAWCGDALADALVVCEATGGYEAALVGFLVARGVRVHRATPYLVKSYIRSLGLKARPTASTRARSPVTAPSAARTSPPIARRPKANANSPPR